MNKKQLRSVLGVGVIAIVSIGASLPRETQTLGSHLPPDQSMFCRSLIGQGLRPSTAESLGLDVWSSPENGGRLHRPEAEALLRERDAEIARLKRPRVCPSCVAAQSSKAS